MNIVLNSRVLIGFRHSEADRLARLWKPEEPIEIQWMQSPSDLCVLSVSDVETTRPDDRYGRIVEHASLPLASKLEETLRVQLGLKLGT
jgi:hypothetical protein